MKKLKFLIIPLFGLGMIIHTCQTSRSPVVPDQPFERLSQYQFFMGLLSDLEPAERVIPYDLNTPLFSDYAYKARFVWMPEGTAAGYTTDEVLDFPEKTVLIKNFYYLDDERDPSEGRRIVETQLLINRSEEWEARTYTWNNEQTEAYLEVTGGDREISWIDKQGLKQTINYKILNKNQCKSCHLTGNKQIPLGPKVSNLNRSFKYANGNMNQLDKWASVHYLKGYNPADEHPKLAVWNDVTSGTLPQRAMAYLDINCGPCHNPEGSVNASGIYKATVSTGAGTGGHIYSIVPGKPEESIMINRMSSSDPSVLMPEVGRTLVHREGVELISEWIERMEAGN